MRFFYPTDARTREEIDHWQLTKGGRLYVVFKGRRGRVRSDYTGPTELQAGEAVMTRKEPDMKTAGTIQTGGICERCGIQIPAGRTVLFLDRTPYPRFICCPAPGEAADVALNLEKLGQYGNAAQAWRLASARCIGHSRAARYADAAARCEKSSSPE